MFGFFQNFLYLSSWMSSICDCMSAILATVIEGPKYALVRTSSHLFSLSPLFTHSWDYNDKEKSIPGFTSSLYLSQGIFTQLLLVLSIVLYDT